MSNRRPTFAILGLLIATLAADASAGAAIAESSAAPIQVFDPGALHFTRLDNGLRVVVLENHCAPLVAVNVVIRAGTVRETAHDNGISHFLEHMIFRAARGGGEDLLSGPIEAVGGMVNAGSLRDFNSFRAVTASRHLALALDTLAQALLHATFDSSAVFSERLVLLRELQELADEPEVAVWDVAFKAAYGDHPYGRPIGGTRSSLVRINADALADFHHRWYVPDNASVVIVGDVDAPAAIEAAARAFSAWKGSIAAYAPAPLPAAPTLDRPRRHVENREIPNAVVLMGFLAPGIADTREVCAMDLLLFLLSEGYTARLRRALVNTKLAEKVSVNFLTQELPGLFGIQVTCAPEQVPRVRKALERELLQLRQEPLRDEELATARRRLIHDYVFGNETMEQQATTLGFYEAIATYEFAVTYLDEVRSLTAVELQAVARKYLDPERAVWVEITPRERTDESSPPAQSPSTPEVNSDSARAEGETR